MKHDELKKEIALIRSPGIRKIVQKTLKFAPEYFWTCSASQTGLHHRPEECKRGGTVLHVRRAVLVADELCKCFSLSKYGRDLVLAATILHDICKYGYPTYTAQLIQGHGVLVANVMRDAGLLKPNEPDSIVVEILNLTSTHMGRWDNPYQFPMYLRSLVVHLADYISSRMKICVEI